MKTVNIDQLEPGMILAESIYNEENALELLARDTVITKRHIDLLTKTSIIEVKIKEAADEVSDDLESIHQAIQEEIDTEIEHVLKSVMNQNMKINVLTGENALPIDERHKKIINETKEIFSDLVDLETVAIETVEKNVKKMLPDMIRNNDVMMRLSQLEKSDAHTFEHSLRVSILASNIAKWLDYDGKHIEEVAQAGLLFDIGKMKLPQYILNKEEEERTEEEEMIYRKHPQLGYNVLLRTEGVLSSVKYAALQHHERMDGSGFPLRLKAGQIHEYAKIIMVCDVFDKLITDPPQGKGLSKMEAAEYLNWNTNSSFDARIVYVLIKKISEYMLGKKAVLNTGEVGKIIYVNVNHPTRPTLQVGDRIVDLVKEKKLKIVKIIESAS